MCNSGVFLQPLAQVRKTSSQKERQRQSLRRRTIAAVTNGDGRNPGLNFPTRSARSLDYRARRRALIASIDMPSATIPINAINSEDSGPRSIAGADPVFGSFDATGVGLAVGVPSLCASSGATILHSRLRICVASSTTCVVQEYSSPLKIVTGADPSRVMTLSRQNRYSPNGRISNDGSANPFSIVANTSNVVPT